MILLLRDRSHVIATKNVGEERLMSDLFQDRPGTTLTQGIVTTRANTLPGHSQNPYVSKQQLAEWVETRAREIAGQMGESTTVQGQPPLTPTPPVTQNAPTAQ